jgi:Tol biopolymer transport system component
MRRQVCGQLALLLVVLPAAAVGQGTFTLEQALSAPFPEGVIAAPTGTAVAWRLNAAGARNIWVASGPDYAGRQVTNFPDDDGLQLSSLVWSPDGRTLVFTRGTGPNRAGDYPNPAGIANGTTRTLWRVTIDGNVLKLGEGAGPAIQPHEERVAFVRAGHIW